MKRLQDILTESIFDTDKSLNLIISLQKPKFVFTLETESGRAQWSYGEILGEENEAIGLYEFYDSTAQYLTLFVNDEIMNQWYDKAKHEADGWGSPSAVDYITNQCQDQARKLFNINLKNDRVYVWNFSDYVGSIEGGAVPFEGEEYDEKILNKWIKWLKFFNKTVKKLSKNYYDLISDISVKTWKTYF